MSTAPRPRAVDRRRVLAAGLAGTALGIAGCGVRLEEGAPAIPFVPTRQPLSGEQELVALVGECRSLASEAAALGTAVGASLATLHTRQADVLHDALVTRGVPPKVVSASTPPSAPTPTPTPTPAQSGVGALRTREAAALATPTAWAVVERDLQPSVAALLAQRQAAAVRLGLTLPPPSDLGRPWTQRRSVVTVLTATRAALWTFEVVAAQSTGDARRRALDHVETLSTLVRAQVAACGPAAPPPALDHAAPPSGGSPSDLARQGAGALRDAYGAVLPDALSEAGGDAWSSLPRWLGEVEVLAVAVGLPPAPFPGLRA